MLLAVDTSNEWMGLAIYDGEQVIGERAWRSSQHHTVELAPAIQELLTSNNLKMENVTAVGVAIGPGSFTSLRVGLALAKGIAFARNIPLIGIPTLDILARALPESNLPLAVAIGAGRGRYALGWYKSVRKLWQAEGPARVVSVEAIKDEAASPSVVCGEFTGEVRQKIESNPNAQLTSLEESQRKPAMLAKLAWARFQNGDVDDAASLAPIYLHTAAPIET
ncbi:MAG: tRNA (adenosine(37)-N6)-threonylcarbamoyltransferase complex dimerization subunit type 1 TsaB [Anaerolineales bacterium]|nr:tRNA (adenosine(37)-N6)-threonylcarbamoyltransferase complex dimerization subunit type 1 TsaB [Anaerolineales bacterium]HMR99904.1 tRNA (adenosine(37)-N6)-threonylcarbamoyltransferase complex dimerization subunit type 1 TsaB [Anaerolineales bacterium]HNQ95688.1 tRNA (adenosine(37)-N6)-threonylcarbamoyltransferase complex dimerization subunit type 1 TsaB [Anaerolineales bacterium]